MYDVDYFIRKFEKIPEFLWCINRRHDSKGGHCAHGWCNLDDIGYSDEENALRKLASFFGYYGVGPINNGDDKRYQQPTPKQRILAALYDIKKLQQPQHTDITKQLAVLPIDETSDLTLIKSNV